MRVDVTKPPPYPEHEKLTKIKENSQLIGEFLDWALDKDVLKTSRKWRGIKEALAEFYSIDLDKLENEKVDMLRRIRGEVLPAVNS